MSTAVVFAVGLIVLSTSALAFVATMADLAPAESLEHPEGISLRQESCQ